MQKVVLFGRVSSVGDKQSYERQKNDLTAFAESKHYQIVGVFAEKISGAAKNNERAELMKMVTFV